MFHAVPHAISVLQFDARRRASPDAAVEPFVKQSVGSAGLLQKVFGGQPPKLSTQVRLDIVARLGWAAPINASMPARSCLDGWAAVKNVHGIAMPLVNTSWHVLGSRCIW